MNALIVTPYYPPVISTLSGMMQELAEALTDRGHHVTVATAWLPNKVSRETHCNDLAVYSNERGVSVIRIKTPLLNSRNYLLRGFSQLLLPYLFWKLITKYVKKTDVIAVYTPPLTLAVIGSLVKKRFGARFVLNVQDIFPQNAIDLGIMKNRLLIRFFEYIELNAYRSADQITSHTKRSLRFLAEQKEVPSTKVHLITNWINTEPYRNACGIDFRKKFHLGGKLVFLFAGVMGPSQNLDLLIEAAIHVKRVSDEICFLLVGDGTEKARLMSMVQEYSLDNVIFRPLVPLEQYPDLLKSVDAGIVSLSSLNKTPVVPAKILGYMSASLPVIAILQKESDGHDLIGEAKCGYSILSDCSSKDAADLFIKLYNEKDRFTEYGENGFRYVSEHFTKDARVNKLIKLLESDKVI
jgi:glycosyltransferase involved in cell wall biosynthesis